MTQSIQSEQNKGNQEVLDSDQTIAEKKKYTKPELNTQDINQPKTGSQTVSKLIIIPPSPKG